MSAQSVRPTVWPSETAKAKPGLSTDSRTTFIAEEQRDSTGTVDRSASPQDAQYAAYLEFSVPQTGQYLTKGSLMAVSHLQASLSEQFPQFLQVAALRNSY